MRLITPCDEKVAAAKPGVMGYDYGGFGEACMTGKRARRSNNSQSAFASVLRLSSTAAPASATVDQRRKIVAELCKQLGRAAGTPLQREINGNGTTTVSEIAKLHLPPRQRQTLERLLRGDSEKQIAIKLRLSPHTIHSYVKALHKRLGVSSRGELLSRFVISSSDK
jgi:DNA-binding CsgD family transcriptional regulator